MKEITFLKQNHEKWLQFEAMLNSQQGANPDALADLFIRITDDLAWARTFYPGSNTEKYLNDLAARIHQEIYKNKKERRSRLISFWTHEIPQLMAKHRMNLLIAFLIFTVSTWVGVISAQHDEGFVRIVLGDDYVDQTLKRISEGNPLGVYQSDNHFAMFLFIALNNSKVALVCIVAGIFGWIGVTAMQFFNGVMLGSFLYFLYQHGAYHEAMLTVWIHGVVEIWCIVVAGAAGMALGNGLWFPGAWPRGVSFMRGTREALKIGIGLIPFFFLAAFFEGFVTRFVQMNDVARMLIIFSAMIFVTWYFLYWPFMVEQREKRSSRVSSDQKPDRLPWMQRSAFIRRIGAGGMYMVIIGIVFILIPVVMNFLRLYQQSEHPGIAVPPVDISIVAGCGLVGVLSLIAGALGIVARTSGMRLSPRFVFMLTIGGLLLLLPTIAIIMQIKTRTTADGMTYFFFAFCYTAAIVLIVFAFLGKNLKEEEELVISRKASGKASAYERNASATKA